MTNVSKFAMDIETKELNFLSKMAEAAQEPGVRRIFEEAVKDEQKTISAFNRLCSSDGSDAACQMSDELRKPSRLPLDRMSAEKEAARIHDDLEAYKLIMQIDEQIESIYRDTLGKLSDRSIRRAMEQVVDIKDKEAKENEEAYLFAHAPEEMLESAEFSNTEDFHQFGRDIG